jgi:hypothetical protein
MAHYTPLEYIPLVYQERCGKATAGAKTELALVRIMTKKGVSKIDGPCAFFLG